MVKIITDSSSNITQEEAKSLGVTVMPLTISFGNIEYLDGIDIGFDEFYTKLAESKEFPHTSQLTEEQIREAEAEAVEAEKNEIIVEAEPDDEPEE